MTNRPNHDLRVRTIINGCSAILIALFIFLAEMPAFRWVFATAVALVAGTAVWEYCQLVKKKGLFPPIALSVGAVVLYVFAIFFKTQGPHVHFHFLWTHAPEIILGLALFGCFVYFAANAKPPIANIATTFLGIVYVGVPFGLFIRIMYFFTYDGRTDLYAQGSWWLIYLVAVTKSSDIGGYFVGRYMGRRKLALKLSPNKTLEGALGGLLASTLMSLFICFLGKTVGHIFTEFSWLSALILGLVIGIVGQVGDLAESLLKRDAGVKDSNAIPGVGGILDMIDSLLFTAPIVYVFLRTVYDSYN